RVLIERVNRGEVTQKDAQLEIEHFWAGALRRAVIDGDVDTGSVMAGQSVGMVTREQSTQEVLDEFIAQALAVVVRRGATARGRGARRCHRGDGATAGASRCAIASRFRLSPGNRRGHLSLADGCAHPARRPRPRRSRRPESYPAELYRG